MSARWRWKDAAARPDRDPAPVKQGRPIASQQPPSLQCLQVGEHVVHIGVGVHPKQLPVALEWIMDRISDLIAWPGMMPPGLINHLQIELIEVLQPALELLA